MPKFSVGEFVTPKLGARVKMQIVYMPYTGKKCFLAYPPAGSWGYGCKFYNGDGKRTFSEIPEEDLEPFT